MLQFDKSIYPVVLHLHIHESTQKLKKWGKINLGEELTYDLSYTPRTF